MTPLIVDSFAGWVQCPLCRENARGDLPLECERRDCPGHAATVASEGREVA